ncbi:hypothetical protein PENSTE_c001G08666 [Penicillium steckii]|uniref:RRM domain-containing protein n=1 Tax=Penicillium steckii TaxID=303698 RepID=A0A1V6U1B3_9EURO|nr:hypothetical protein PENSTE_c001G08666 [Penicillium steckii]
MTDKLPPPLLALFQPRPPLRYIPPGDRAPEDCQKSTISGVAQYLPEAKKFDEESPYNATDCWIQRKWRQKQEKKEQLANQLTEGLESYNPENDPQARGDPYRTLFVARLSYDAKEADLEREFGRFGPIERIRIVKDTISPKAAKRPAKGYAFIVYEREKDMKAAYKETDGIRIKDRRVLVDVERGRTTKGWKPRRFGGGLGGRGYTKAMPSRPMGFNAPSGPGGFGGGFRGGFGGRGFRGGGFRGDRGDRGDRFGPRGGVGYQGGRNGFGGQPPPNAPSGPGGGGGRGGFGGGYGGGGRFDRGVTGSNREPVRPRDSYADRDRRDRDGDRYRDRDRMSDRNGGDRYRDRDRERDRYGGREDYGRKRHREDDEREDPRSRRRYD